MPTTYTNITKPTNTSYTNTNAPGRESFDDSRVSFDDSSVFFDGMNPSQYTSVAKPVLPTSSVIIASYGESNRSDSNDVKGTSNLIKMGQSFSVASAYFLDRAVFNLSKTGSPVGVAYARVYPVTSGGLPTTPSVVTSQAVSVATLSGSFSNLTFPFISSVIVPSGSYAVTYEPDDLGAVNYTSIGRDTTSPTGAGQRVFMNNSSVWSTQSNVDTIFYIYGTPSNYIKVNKPS